MDGLIPEGLVRAAELDLGGDFVDAVVFSSYADGDYRCTVARTADGHVVLWSEEF
jgi:hypothetical protein